MRVQEGRWYATQVGRVIGPLQRMQHSLTESFLFNDYFEPGIWNAHGKCGNYGTQTSRSYGNLIQEVEEPVNETLHLYDSV